MQYNDFELLNIQAEVLYVHNIDNRLLRINESDADDPAPRFYLSRSRAGNIWRFRHDLSDEVMAELEALAAAEPVNPDLPQMPALLEKYNAVLERHAPIYKTYCGPSFYLPELDAPIHAIIITQANLGLLERDFPYTLSTLDERSPIMVIAEDGTAVAVTYTARSTTLAGEAGVHTLESHRGGGLAVDTVRGWAAAFRASGRIPFYSTWWANTASQAVARKLGAVQYGVNFSIT
jgi:hypothetical protein